MSRYLKSTRDGSIYGFTDQLFKRGDMELYDGPLPGQEDEEQDDEPLVDEEAIKGMDLDELRVLGKQMKIRGYHNTGEDNLRAKLIELVNASE